MSLIEIIKETGSHCRQAVVEIEQRMRPVGGSVSAQKWSIEITEQRSTLPGASCRLSQRRCIAPACPDNTFWYVAECSLMVVDVLCKSRL